MFSSKIQAWWANTVLKTSQYLPWLTPQDTYYWPFMIKFNFFHGTDKSHHDLNPTQLSSLIWGSPSLKSHDTAKFTLIFKIVTCLAALDLNYGTWDIRSSLWHAESFNCSMRDQAPWLGIESRSPALGVALLATGPPGKSLNCTGFNSCHTICCFSPPGYYSHDSFSLGFTS